jgi:tetratricopeptide (TPR) repeat protein
VQSIPDENEVKSIEDLGTVIELYHHNVRAGRYSDAVELLYKGINDLLFYRFGAHQTLIELLRALFPDGEDKPPRLDSESYQSWTMTALANSYSLSGQLRRAVPLLERKNAIREKLKDDVNLSSGLSDLALSQTSLGEFANAEQNLNRAINLCVKTGEKFIEAVNR